jgi:hypothetical protein
MSRHLGLTILTATILVGASFAVAQQARRTSNEKSAAKQGSGTVSTDDAARRPTKNGKRNLNTQPMVLTLPRKAAALAFARKHHPELAKLLVGLEPRNRKAYSRAMHELYRTSERLARAQGRLTAERYEMELDAWKLDSRIRLLAARVSLSKKNNPKLEAELKQALLDRVNIRIQKIRQEQTRLNQRLEKLNASLLSIEKNREKTAAQYLLRAKRGLSLKNRNSRTNKTFVNQNGKTAKKRDKK